MEEAVIEQDSNGYPHTRVSLEEKKKKKSLYIVILLWGTKADELIITVSDGIAV